VPLSCAKGMDVQLAIAAAAMSLQDSKNRFEIAAIVCCPAPGRIGG